MSVNVLVLRAAGINCDEEVMHAWRLSGANPTLVHVNAAADAQRLMANCSVVTIPGGFSYGDDIAAGAILGRRLADDWAGMLSSLVARGGAILGICNGFQALVKAGFLPGGRFRSKAALTSNASGRFEARWVRMRVATDRCPFLTLGDVMELPVEHAEGRAVVSSDETLREMTRDGFVALQYTDDVGPTASYPANPNGSAGAIAGLCDETGRILGLMPHPDRYLDATQHPLWTLQGTSRRPDGLAMFARVVEYFLQAPPRKEESLDAGLSAF